MKNEKSKLPSCFHLLDHLLIALQDFPKDHMFHVQVRRLLGSFRTLFSFLVVSMMCVCVLCVYPKNGMMIPMEDRIEIDPN